MLPTSSDAAWWDVSLVSDVNANEEDAPMTTPNAGSVGSLERSVNCIILA